MTFIEQAGSSKKIRTSSGKERCQNCGRATSKGKKILKRQNVNVNAIVEKYLTKTRIVRLCDSFV